MADNNVRLYVKDRFGYNRPGNLTQRAARSRVNSFTYRLPSNSATLTSKTSTSYSKSQHSTKTEKCARNSSIRVRKTEPHLDIPQTTLRSKNSANKCLDASPSKPNSHPQLLKSKLEVTVKRLLSGAFAGVVSRTAVAPLDVAKLKFMLQKEAVTGNILTVLKDTVRKEGVRGLFRGNGLNCCRVGPSKALELCVFETLNTLLGRADIAGGAAGAVSTIATYPLEVLRTRVALDAKVSQGGLVTAMRRIAHTEGRKALYRGCAFSVAGVIPYTAAQYLVYDALCRSYKSFIKTDQVPAGLHMLFGSVAAISASAATFPLEVYRRQLQLSGGTNAVALQSVKSMIQAGGIGGVYRGIGASCLKLGPAAGVSFLCYEAAKTVLQIGVPPSAACAAVETDLEMSDTTLELQAA